MKNDKLSETFYIYKTHLSPIDDQLSTPRYRLKTTEKVYLRLIENLKDSLDIT